MPERTFRVKSANLVLANQRKQYMNVIAVGLFQAPYVPTETSTLEDVLAAEADFSGYSRKILSMDTIERLGLASYLLFSNTLATFQHNGGANSNNINGMFVLAQTAPGPPPTYELVSCTVFDQPIPMSQANDTISRIASEVEA